MRIGIDARFYSPAFTGIGRYVYELVHHLLEIDKENEYVLFLNDPYFKDARLPTGAKNIKKVRVNAAHYSFAEQWKFFRILQKENLNLMHFTHFNAPILYRRPSVVTIHDLTLSFFPGKKMTSWIHRLGYNFTLGSVTKHARHIITVSENTKKDLMKLLRIPAKDISVIYEGVSSQFRLLDDKKIISATLKKHHIKEPYLLYTGVWRSHKNLVNLLRAFVILRNEKNFTGSLVITGKPDPWYPEVTQTTKDLGLSPHVIFTDMVPEEDLVALYNGALAYVFPSLYEGFGLPALEAFACGVPVCASATSSLPEICGKGNAAFFDPVDPVDMANVIASVIFDSEKIAHLRERGLTRVKDFSWREMANATLSIYNTFDVRSHSRTAS